MTIEDKMKGVLVGVAVGDALGAPCEEIPKHPCKVQRPVTEMIGGGWLNIKPGQVTDDTEMTLCIARSIAEKGCFDGQDIARRFVEWMDDNPIGTGSTTRSAIIALKDGAPWHLAGLTIGIDGRLGNGSVMRCSPIALLDYLDGPRLVYHSHEQSAITHAHPDCVNSAMFVTSIIAGMLKGQGKQDAYQTSLYCMPFTSHLRQLYGSIPSLQRGEVKPIGHVVNTTQLAVYTLLTTDSFEESIITAANGGGDADTIAAITGSMAGALYGDGAIPERWKSKFTDRHEKPLYEELCSLAVRIKGIAERNY